MERMHHLLTALLLATAVLGCGMIPGFGDDEDEDRAPSINLPGVHVGPDGVQAPGVSVTPQGVQAPGVNVTPQGVQAPGVNVTPQGVQAPGVNVTPQGVQIGGAAPVAGGATAVPTSFGIAECDEYARRSCNCSNNLVRAQLCTAAHASFSTWSQAVSATPAARPGVTEGCRSAAASLIPTCGQ